MYSHVLQREAMCKYKINVNSFFKPIFYALSNGAFGFPVSSVLYAENGD
jgi:hypothetical protein